MLSLFKLILPIEIKQAKAHTQSNQINLTTQILMALRSALGTEKLTSRAATITQEPTKKRKEIYSIFQIYGLLPECSVAMIKMDS